MKRKAFTLVELLVVIGIIALLISILLPTLNSARESAKKVVCLSNIRQMAMATVGYANDNNGAIAPRFRYTSTGDLASASSANSGQIWEYQTPLWSTYFHDPNYPGGPSIWSVGILVNEGYLQFDEIDPTISWTEQKLPSMFSCPAAERGANTAFTDTFRAGYMYNPHWAYISTNNLRKQHRYEKLVQMEPEKTLLMDVMPTFPNGVGHIGHLDGQNRPSWNLAFPDGHATNVVSKTVGEWLVGRPASHWDRLDDYRDVLETIAAGQNPRVDGWPFDGYGFGGSRRVPPYYLK